ncbi:MAG TPA: tetratricopeptide repeat protein, partial [Gemmataceae bacterium]|nr:tetratricopeptide repeat protein [Gemmataceae bacterium]
MSSATTLARRRRLRRGAALGHIVVGLAALAAAAWWRWGRAEPVPGPSEAALAEADPEVAAAIRVARRQAMREPRSLEAWAVLGQVLLANGFGPEADACLARAEALAPDDPRWPYLRAYGTSPDPAAVFAAANRAVVACRRAGVVEPGPYLFLAELYIERGDREEADRLCRGVLEQDPGQPRAHLDMGQIALADDDAAAAIPHLRRAAESPALRRTAYGQLAAAYQRRGDAKAAADYARRSRLAPPDEGWSDPYVDRMQEFTTGRQVRVKRLERLRAQGRLKEALALVREFLAADPSDAHMLVGLGVVLLQAGDLAGAEQALRKAESLAPDSLDPTYHLAVVLYKQGERLEGAGDRDAAAKFEAAADTARRVLAVKPDHAQAHGFLGLALKHLGRRKEAIESFRAAVRCWPEDPDGHLALGEALAEDGQTAEAVNELRYACELADPDDARPRQALERARASGRPKSWLW